MLYEPAQAYKDLKKKTIILTSLRQNLSGVSDNVGLKPVSSATETS